MRASRAEIKIEEIFRNNNLNFNEEYEFPGLASSNGRPLRSDLAVFDDDDNLDFLIEYQGKQHYMPVSKFGGSRGLHQQNYNDKQKRRFCALKNINLIEIPYTEENLISYDYIMKKAGY